MESFFIYLLQGREGSLNTHHFKKKVFITILTNNKNKKSNTLKINYKYFKKTKAPPVQTNGAINIINTLHQL